jgi:hypothetical protein
MGTKREAGMSHYYSPEHIVSLDNGRLTLNNDLLQTHVARALSKIPSEVVDDLMENCLIVASRPNGSAYITKETLTNKNIILISDKLLSGASDETIEWFILYEVAHFHLGHRDRWAEGMSPGEHEIQEKEANYLFADWLESYKKTVQER